MRESGREQIPVLVRESFDGSTWQFERGVLSTDNYVFAAMRPRSGTSCIAPDSSAASPLLVTVFWSRQ